MKRRHMLNDKRKKYFAKTQVTKNSFQGKFIFKIKKYITSPYTVPYFSDYKAHIKCFNLFKNQHCAL